MRWINQAFKLGPKTWVWLIIIKKQYDIQNIFSRNERKASKNYSKVMYGHSKWFPNNFELDFGSIQKKFFTKCLRKHFFLKSFEVTCSKNTKNPISDLSYPFRTLRGPAPRYPQVQKVKPDLTCARPLSIPDISCFPETWTIFALQI